VTDFGALTFQQVASEFHGAPQPILRRLLIVKAIWNTQAAISLSSQKTEYRHALQIFDDCRERRFDAFGAARFGSADSSRQSAKSIDCGPEALRTGRAAAA
jgi:hypothetical protein